MNKCRISWVSLETGFKSHNNWVDVSKRPQLDNEIASLNRRYLGFNDYWIECD